MYPIDENFHCVVSRVFCHMEVGVKRDREDEPSEGDRVTKKPTIEQGSRFVSLCFFVDQEANFTTLHK